MSTVCRIGVKYIAEKMDEQQQRLDQALTASVQANPKAGMQGQPLPYQLRSDAFVTGIILICFVLFSYSLKNGKKYVLQRIKALFQYVFTLTIISCVLSGLYIYEYISETDFMLIRSVSNGLMLGIYIGMSLFYISFKWVAYQFVNWIFFDKERNNYWIQTSFDLVSGISFLLFPLMLLIIYFNLLFH